MSVPLSLPYLDNATQRVPVFCVVIPELVAGVDLLLTLDDYDSLCFTADELKYYNKGCELDLVEESSERTFAKGNGVESAVQIGTDCAARNSVGEESTNASGDDACCDAT
ncbi:hypothetical protein HPB52_024901 [Rhipicephalus sanguineus]|uniref:Uncharacterized protein n=1 Tax=Rhipicephalus sanguineus TaxID=34632 RepID=A0A9D4TDM5_RHISA|nr:hypothetical protein HPB52_024901 [Rhipicephalus sanguineus]